MVKTNVTAVTGKRSPSQQPLNGLLSLPDAVSTGSVLPFLWLQGDIGRLLAKLAR
jgi:hypothetical protein